MPFMTEPEPERGANLPVLPGISRIVANNPSPMTYFGTNTYLIETEKGTVVLDPGPEDHPEHVDAIMRHTGGQIAFLLVSHTHHDHVGAVPALQEKCGAPSVGFKISGLDSFDADIKLSDGDVFAGLTALLVYWLAFPTYSLIFIWVYFALVHRGAATHALVSQGIAWRKPSGGPPATAVS